MYSDGVRAYRMCLPYIVYLCTFDKRYCENDSTVAAVTSTHGSFIVFITTVSRNNEPIIISLFFCFASIEHFFTLSFSTSFHFSSQMQRANCIDIEMANRWNVSTSPVAGAHFARTNNCLERITKWMMLVCKCKETTTFLKWSKQHGLMIWIMVDVGKMDCVRLSNANAMCRCYSTQLYHYFTSLKQHPILIRSNV